MAAFNADTRQRRWSRRRRSVGPSGQDGESVSRGLFSVTGTQSAGGTVRWTSRVAAAACPGGLAADAASDGGTCIVLPIGISSLCAASPKQIRGTPRRRGPRGWSRTAVHEVT